MQNLANNQEEGVHNDVEKQGREGVARVFVIPQANLDWHRDGRVKQEDPTQKVHH
jgi:hypothetical protein